MRWTFRVVTLMLAGIGLAACSGTQIYKQHFDAHYSFQDLMAYHGGKDMKLEIRGAPRDVDPAALAKIAADAMSRRNHGLPIQFTAAPVQSAEAPTRMVLLFSPASSALPARVCDGQAQPQSDARQDQAMLAYCKQDRALSATWVTFPTGAKAESQAFADSLASAVRTITPNNSPFGKAQKCQTFC